MESIDRLLLDCGISPKEIPADESMSSEDSRTSLGRESLMPQKTKGTRLAMDQATKLANDLLQEGKKALEEAGNMKRECKATVHQSLQELYEVTLSLADSRSRHKYNLEAERTRHAKELVRVERAHNKEVAEIRQTSQNLLEATKREITETLEEAKSIRGWLGYEMDGPFNTIAAISEAVTRIEAAVSKKSERTPDSDNHTVDPKIKEDLKLLTDHTEKAARQLDSLKWSVESLVERASKTQSSEVVDCHPDLQEQDLQIKEMAAELKVLTTTVRELGNKIATTPPPSPPDNTEATAEALRNSIKPLYECLEIVSSEVRLLRDTKTHPTEVVPNLSTEVAMEDMKKRLSGIEKGVENIHKNTKTANGSASAEPSIQSAPQPKLSYAQIIKTPPPPRPNHTLIVTSTNPRNTGDNVIELIRTALDMKNTGAKVDRVRKAKHQKVVLSCSTKEDLHLVRSRVQTNKYLKVEVAKNNNPLIIIKDVLSYHSDTEIVEHLLVQNKHLLQGVDLKETTIKVRYRKRARNPHECHPVLELSPSLHKRFVEAGKLYIGLQRRPVADQSPLVQCTKCLGFGHTKAICQEKVDLCSHCGLAHLWEKCPSRTEGKPPTCRNCSKAHGESSDIAHNAFSDQCREKQKWDAIARSRITYC